jgi:hypothetical protein
MLGESWEQHGAFQRVECDDFDHIDVPGGFCSGVSMSTGGGLTKSWIAELSFGGPAYALRGYGVTLGSSSSHDPFFSRPTGRREAAFLRMLGMVYAA